jgi:DNA-binding Lrp family transcriptional regulator
MGLSPRQCLERVRRLEHKGVIRGFSVLLAPDALGHHIMTLAEIVLRDPSARRFASGSSAPCALTRLWSSCRS